MTNVTRLHGSCAILRRALAIEISTHYMSYSEEEVDVQEVTVFLYGHYYNQ